jgi:hypothetical protein
MAPFDSCRQRLQQGAPYLGREVPIVHELDPVIEELSRALIKKV